MLRNSFLLYISKQLDIWPGLKKRISELRYWIWRFELRMRRYHIDQTANLDWIYSVNPNKIIYAHRRLFTMFRDKGRVISGDWDLPKNRKRFEDMAIYQALCQRFLNHKNWEDTQFYNVVLAEIIDGKIKWCCKSIEQLDNRCRKLDELYQNIKDNGYQTQRRPNTHSGSSFEEEEITVSIARTGEFLFNGGLCLLSIAKITGLKEVPVKVVVKHSEWVGFRNHILAHTQSRGEKVYQTLLHPDLADVPSVYEGDERFDIIKQNISINAGTLLDIGAHWGYFCHKFEDEGFECYAVENSPRNIYFMNKLRQAENKTFKIFYGSIFDYQDLNSFDVVLALNIFHHFVQQKSSYLKLTKLLQRLKMRELFFQSARHDEAQMEHAYKPYSPDDFVDFILEHSCLKQAKYIGQSKDERPLYKLH